jgi:hypothetical protein
MKKIEESIEERCKYSSFGKVKQADCVRRIYHAHLSYFTI